MRVIRLRTLVLAASSVAALMPLAAAEVVPLPTSRPPADGAPDALTTAKQPGTISVVPTPVPPPPAPAVDVPTVPATPADDLPPNGLSADAILRSVTEDATQAAGCQAELKALRAQFTPLDPIIADGGCGIAHPVAVTGLGDGIALSETATLSCPMAVGLANWVKQAVDPLSKLYLNGDLKTLGISTSYQCRTRNGVSSAKLSEHSFANGLDVHFFEAEGAERVTVQERDDDSGMPARFQAAARGAACAYFTTVLGPMTNAAHGDHFHLDMRLRNGGYRLCE
ncbi:extensin family protein [Pararhizobium sp. IMCC21322]|uniref:extensin-like domain-containing protein n=1 Tax=Pararhizobium sp. IMCC21322 TaxID=3067903 RepID=UPI0027413DB3|nr:extensin family protein [Pararhizobium sp. IMCC21322]